MQFMICICCYKLALKAEQIVASVISILLFYYYLHKEHRKRIITRLQPGASPCGLTHLMLDPKRLIEKTVANTTDGTLAMTITLLIFAAILLTLEYDIGSDFGECGEHMLLAG